MTREELEQKKELELAEQELHEAELREWRETAKEKWAKIRANKDVILSLIDHDRTSCSDSNLANGWWSASYGARCRKCVMMEVLNDEWLDDQFDISFDVTVTEIK